MNETEFLKTPRNILLVEFPSSTLHNVIYAIVINTKYNTNNAVLQSFTRGDKTNIFKNDIQNWRGGL